MRISDLSSDVCSSDLDQRLVEREIGKDRDDAGGHHDRLAADLVAKPAEEDETGDDDRQRGGDEEIGGGAIDPGETFELEERIEMRGEADHRLPCDRTERRDKHDLQVPALAEGGRKSARLNSSHSCAS